MKRLTLAATLLLIPTAAFAHPGHGETTGLFAGLQHPLSGVDHLTTMIAVGLLAAAKGGRALWLWPITFVAVMIGGAMLGMGRMPLPMVEPAIIASVIVLGLLLALSIRLPVWVGALVIAAAALFHGHAHGLEAAGPNGIAYTTGFVAATAALHLIGVAIGSVALQPALRAAGAACVVVGAALALHMV